MTRFIPVKTSLGMFSDELSVSIQLVTGNTVSLFADKNLLIDDGNGNSLLETMLVSEDIELKKQTVLLPTETFETASRYVEVHL
jgi:hypothetical protein